MKEITIDTVQGIGDLIWVYRKLSLLYDRINMNVLVVGHSEVQERAASFLETLDKIGIIHFKLVHPKIYNRVAKKLCIVDKIRNEYSVNAWLESGVHIDSIDSFPVCWDINLKSEPFMEEEEYLLVYVSGCAHNSTYHQMLSQVWARLSVKTSHMLGVNKIILIGAPYDRTKLFAVRHAIKNIANIGTVIITNASIQQAIGVVAKAKYFISYQSGLSIIAEELETPTHMIYFPENRKMISTWIRKENLQKGLIANSFFGDSVDDMVEVTKNHIMGIM